MILDYCRDLFDILENLEGLLKSSEELREDYRQKNNRPDSASGIDFRYFSFNWNDCLFHARQDSIF